MTQREKAIIDYLRYKGLNDIAVCAIMGNILAESACCADNLQSNGNDNLNMSDEEFTEAMDAGKYDNFVHDGYGYGLCQWTYYSRKKALFDYCMKANVSVSNTFAQLDFMLKEMKGYKDVWKALTDGTSLVKCTEIVMKRYENPANQTTYAVHRRCVLANDYYTAIHARTNRADEDVARMVIAGKYGNGTARKKALEADGYNYAKIQKLVNKIIKEEKKK